MGFFSKRSRRRAAEQDDLLDYVLADQDIDANGKIEDPKDLERESLRYLEIAGADLRHAILRYADLSDTDLSGADLRNADLSWARLDRANLTGANLSRARMIDATLRDADLTDADFSMVTGLLPECMKGASISENTKWPSGFSPDIPRRGPLLHD